MSTLEILTHAHELIARSGGSSASSTRPPIFKVVGIILAIASGVFIGVSFVLKKLGLLKANAKYNEEAGEGYGYLKNWYWWSGMILMIIGEVCNFVAYAFVDAILVTPLGALSVVITTILSAIFLKERLSFVGKVGCFNCIVGSVVIVINAPEQSAVANIQDMKKLVVTPGFLTYTGVVIIGCVFIALWAGPRYGKKSMMVYLSICSLIGGLSVVATQGLGAAIIAQIQGKPQFNQWFLYIVLVFVITTLLTEIIYLNKALNLFNAALVTPTYYVFFTSATIVTSAILFQGFKGTPATIATVIMGFLQICTGVILLQLSKSAKDVPDTAVFKGDLDQVRTVAEQAEPEYEPRADTIRGGGAIVRAISSARTKRQIEEAEKLREEHMRPIGENEQVEFDGLRRRRTVMESGQPSLRRQKTIHPPLGMTHFPADGDQSDEENLHPGFFARLRGSRKNTDKPLPEEPHGMAMEGLSPEGAAQRSFDGTDDHVYGLPTGLRKVPQDSIDTSYKPHETTIHWSSDIDQPHSTSGSHLEPPRPPAHGARRQFSFQNVFHRGRATSDASSRPDTAKSHFSFGSNKGPRRSDRAATEEERLGLVKGDSRHLLTLQETRSSEQQQPPPPPQHYSDTEFDEPVEAVSPVSFVRPRGDTGASGPSRSRDTPTTHDPDDSDDGDDLEKGGASRAFL
ncbi:DUF803-domain-containing protein [Pseudovirgaria hyperparasitica]|uniref:DUF803-domain-containing protein n=1 Tax=Pseudovirgaria hyperparasitica TaxID=470096 RepID=A0A6A6VVC3_9PEZI|nr:DUF803-domain-containing protein [Pseudovirgaria hyperparasitica]KAF2753819.1 DUF803-domain-containing protein [Pseudovirgaria hyperparasitica]